MKYRIERNVSTDWIGDVGRSFLADERVIFNLDGDALSWNSEAEDAQVFSQIWEVLVETASFSDKKFISDVIPVLEAKLLSIPLFSRLNTSEIKVSPGHNGTNPFEHTMQVLKSLNTSPIMDDNHRATLRLAAIYHDVGKGLTADISREEIDQWPGCERSGCPDHFVLSALIMERIVSLLGTQEQFKLAIELVLHHHIFEILNTLRGMNEPRAQSIFQTDFLSMENDLLTWLDRGVEEGGKGEYDFLLLIFLLTRADVASIPAYHDIWSAQIDYLFRLVQIIWNDLDTSMRSAFLRSFFLPKDLSYNP